MEAINIKIKTMNIFIAALAFLVSAFVVNGVDANIDENTIYILKNLDEYSNNINNMKNIVEELKAEVENEKDNINNYDSEDYLERLISIDSQIEELKFYNGFTDVMGPGIMMRVSDSTIEDGSLDIMEKIVHDVDITILLNDLKAAGAEAIDVNSQRIVNISEVVCAGPLLKINGVTVPAPFIIQAIGDMDSLYDSVIEEGTYANELKNTYGMEVVVVKRYNQSIPRCKLKSNEIYDEEIAEIAER